MLKDIVEVFAYCNVDYEILDLEDDWKIVVTRQGGHVFGPFSHLCPGGVFWMPESICDRDRFKELIDRKIWNIGGDRVWIAPEIQFNIEDRSRFRETLNTPKTIDPGDFTMSRRGKSILLQQELDLRSYNTVAGSIHLDFRRMILSAANPLRCLPQYGELMEQVSYCGYEQILDLKGSSREDIYAETWDLLQIRPSGTLYIPMYAPLRGTDHYEPAGDHEIVLDSGICLKITGASRYKIAYRSACLTGRFGYLADSDMKDTCLIIINYPNNPSAMYSEEPPRLEGDTGYSIHIYNDDGNSGGFAEMECNLQTIGRPTGIDRSIDRLTKWIYYGERKRLSLIAKHLLGYDFMQ